MADNTFSDAAQSNQLTADEDILLRKKNYC